jgi:phosphopantetheine adenylyltransferase
VKGEKAIVMTSANPLHFGHIHLYHEAVRIFGDGNVKIAVGKAKNRDIDVGRIVYHLAPYKINCDVEEKIALADYCRINSVSYIARGIRNLADADYELKRLDFIDKVCPLVRTIFFPAKSTLSKITSSYLRKLMNFGKFSAVKKYMNEDSMYRFLYKSPEFIVFFGRSCTGKTHYLKNTLKYGSNVVEVDKIFWKIFEKCFGYKEMLKISSESKKLVYQGNKLDNLILAYSTVDFWKLFFSHIQANFSKVNFFIENLRVTKEVFIIDFPAIGNYWSTIPADLRSKLYLVKLGNTLENREKFAIDRNLLDKLTYLDFNYREPDYFDIEKNIDE